MATSASPTPTTPNSTICRPGTSPALRVYHTAETIAFYRANAELLTQEELDRLDERSRELIALLGIRDSDEGVPF